MRTKWIALGAALALATGVTMATAADTSTPGAGSPGQNQAGGDQEKNAGQPAVKDTPPSVTTGQAPAKAPVQKTPTVKDKNSIHQSHGDRDSRGLPKQQ